MLIHMIMRERGGGDRQRKRGDKERRERTKERAERREEPKVETNLIPYARRVLHWIVVPHDCQPQARTQIDHEKKEQSSPTI